MSQALWVESCRLTRSITLGSMGPHQKKSAAGVTLRLAACALWLGVWQVASLAFGSELLFPGPVAVGRRLFGLVCTPSTWLFVASSGVRVVAGLVLGFACALVLALATRRSQVASALLEPPLLVLKSTPVACAIVLLLLWLGSDAVAGAVVFLVVFPALYFALKKALSEVDPKIDQMLRVQRVPAVRRFLAHVWPSVVPYANATLNNACGMAWKAGVAAEVIGSPSLGVGERVYHAKLLLETGDVFAWTIIVIVAAYVLERLVIALVGLSARVALRLSVVGLGEKDAPPLAPARPASCEGLTLSYDARSHVVKNLTFLVEPGEVACLSDASGAGKTTLLMGLAGLKEPMAGAVRGFSPASMVFQEPRLIEGLGALDNVLLSAGMACSRAHVQRLLEEVLPGVSPCAPVRTLSGGQRRRVELVRALATHSAALLLDEPFAALDDEAARVCAALVLRESHGRPVVVATHDARDREALHGRKVSLDGNA